MCHCSLYSVEYVDPIITTLLNVLSDVKNGHSLNRIGNLNY